MKALEFNITPPRWIACKVGGWITHRAKYGRLSGLRLVDRPIPDLPGPRWVRLKTVLGGVCGTDLSLVTLRNHPATILECFARFPAILGHENLAVIDEVGAGVTNWRPGRRVCVEPALGCAAREETPCPACADGRASQCAHPGNAELPPRALIGLNRLTGGSWASHFVAHESQLHAVPDELPDDTAILVDPIASALHAVLRRPPTATERVLVSGSGIIALGVVTGLRAIGFGGSIHCVMRHRFQAELARAVGATDVLIHPRGMTNAQRYDDVASALGGKRLPARFGNRTLLGGADVVYDCTGTGRGLADAIKWTRPRGTMVAVGTSGHAWVDTTPLWFDEINVVGANGRQIETFEGNRQHTYRLVLDWLATGRLKLGSIRVTRFNLTDYRIAFQQLLTRSRHPIIKAVFDPNG